METEKKVTDPQPTPGSRIEKLASICSSTPGTHLTEPISADEEAEHLLEQIEAAGLLVLDPDDALEKILRSLSLDRMSSSYMEMAANVLAALRVSGE